MFYAGNTFLNALQQRDFCVKRPQIPKKFRLRIGVSSGKKHEVDVTPSPVPRVSRTLAETPNISGFLADTGPLTRVPVCPEI